MTSSPRQPYRDAAARKYGVKVEPHSHVVLSLDGDGAFVELSVWIPKEETEQEQFDDRVVAVLEARLKEQQTPCVWTEDDDGVWKTGCGQMWVFVDAGPEENYTKYCHGCGHPVQPVHHVPESIE